MNNDGIMQQGTLKVSEDVIATVAKLATLEIEGVAELSQPKTDSRHIFIKSKHGAIEVDAIGDVVEISISIVVKQGWKINVVAESVQENVKQSIQNMTGIVVSKVNVCIASVVFEEQTEA